MGSSFAAGPGIGRRAPGSPRAAGRSSANYAHQVARRLALELDDVTFSGATTQDMLAATAAGRPAQIDAVTPATKLVTLTGGGNDVGWAPRILLSSLPRPVRAISPVRHQLDSYADPDLTEQRFGTLRDNLLKIAAEVRRRAPGSRLVFVDYLTVLPPDGTTPTGVLRADVAEWGRAISQALRHHPGCGRAERERLRGRVGGERQSPRLVGYSSVDQAFPCQAPARRGALPPQCRRHGGGS